MEEAPLHWSWQRIFGYDTKSTNNQSKTQQMGPHKTIMLPHSKRNNKMKRQPTEWEKHFANRI